MSKSADSQSEHQLDNQQEHQIEYGVPMTYGWISVNEFEVGNCLEITGLLGTRYIFEVTKKIKKEGFEEQEGFKKFDVYIKCIYGKGSLKDSAGKVVNADGRIYIGEKLYIGDAHTHTSAFKEMVVWETKPDVDYIHPIEYGVLSEWVDTRGLNIGDHVSFYAQDGGMFVFRVEGQDEKTGKLLFRLMYTEYQDSGGVHPWKGGKVYGEILASDLAVRVGQDIRTGPIDSLKITKDFPIEDFEGHEVENNVIDSHETEKPANPWLSRDVVMSQAGVPRVDLDEIMQPAFSETEQKVLRILGFSTDLSLITDPSELLNDAQLYYLKRHNERISVSDDSQRAELEILRDTVTEGIASILEKLKT